MLSQLTRRPEVASHFQGGAMKRRSWVLLATLVVGIGLATVAFVQTMRWFSAHRVEKSSSTR
jgi:hypothetical protein